MEFTDRKVFIAGGSGALGSALAAQLAQRGASVVVAGRDQARLVRAAEPLATEPITFDIVDSDSVRDAVAAAVEALGGLDLVVVAAGVAGFGPAMQADPAMVEELFAVNVLGPMEVVRAAAPHLSSGAKVAVISAIIADLPTAQMAEYSAAKAALAAWLGVVRREERRNFSVLDVRPPHLDTGLETRALGGEPPRLPEPVAADKVIEAVMRGLAEDVKLITYDSKARDFTFS